MGYKKMDSNYSFSNVPGDIERRPGHTDGRPQDGQHPVTEKRDQSHRPDRKCSESVSIDSFPEPPEDLYLKDTSLGLTKILGITLGNTICVRSGMGLALYKLVRGVKGGMTCADKTKQVMILSLYDDCLNVNYSGNKISQSSYSCDHTQVQ